MIALKETEMGEGILCTNFATFYKITFFYKAISRSRKCKPLGIHFSVKINTLFTHTHSKLEAERIHQGLLSQWAAWVKRALLEVDQPLFSVELGWEGRFSRGESMATWPPGLFPRRKLEKTTAGVGRTKNIAGSRQNSSTLDFTPTHIHTITTTTASPHEQPTLSFSV